MIQYAASVITGRDGGYYLVVPTFMCDALGYTEHAQLYAQLLVRKEKAPSGTSRKWLFISSFEMDDLPRLERASFRLANRVGSLAAATWLLEEVFGTEIIVWSGTDSRDTHGVVDVIHNPTWAKRWNIDEAEHIVAGIIKSDDNPEADVATRIDEISKSLRGLMKMSKTDATAVATSLLKQLPNIRLPQAIMLFEASDDAEGDEAKAEPHYFDGHRHPIDVQQSLRRDNDVQYPDQVAVVTSVRVLKPTKCAHAKHMEKAFRLVRLPDKFDEFVDQQGGPFDVTIAWPRDGVHLEVDIKPTSEQVHVFELALEISKYASENQLFQGIAALSKGKVDLRATHAKILPSSSSQGGKRRVRYDVAGDVSKSPLYQGLHPAAVELALSHALSQELKGNWYDLAVRPVWCMGMVGSDLARPLLLTDHECPTGLEWVPNDKHEFRLRPCFAPADGDTERCNCESSRAIEPAKEAHDSILEEVGVAAVCDQPSSADCFIQGDEIRALWIRHPHSDTTHCVLVDRPKRRAFGLTLVGIEAHQARTKSNLFPRVLNAMCHLSEDAAASPGHKLSERRTHWCDMCHQIFIDSYPGEAPVDFIDPVDQRPDNKLPAVKALPKGQTMGFKGSSDCEYNLRLNKCLGSGANAATVYVTDEDDADTPEKVVKFVLYEKIAILSELEVLLSMKHKAHEHLVRLYDQLQVPPELGVTGLLMEYAGDLGLSKWMRQQTGPDFYLKMLTVTKQICSGILQLHESNFCFLDLKPDNVHVKAESAKVLDYGMGARVLEEISPDLSRFGTCDFIAPEMAPLGYNKPSTRQKDRKVVEVTLKADTYSAGALLHYLIMGGEPPTRYNSALHFMEGFVPWKPGPKHRHLQVLMPDVISVLESALQKEAKLRPTLGHFIGSLDEILTQLP